MSRQSYLPCSVVALVSICVLCACVAAGATTVKGNRRTLQSGQPGTASTQSVKQADYDERRSGYEHGKGPHYEDESEHYNRGYDGPSEEQYYPEQDGYEGRDDGAYYIPDQRHNGKTETRTLVFQETSRRVPDALDQPITSVFRCAKPEDAPGACINPPPYNGDRYEGDRRDDAPNFIWGALNKNPALTCTWNETGACPSWAVANCTAGTITCTLTPHAEECGCPYKDAWFTANGTFIQYDAQSCEPEYNPGGWGGQEGRRRLASAEYNGGRFYKLRNPPAPTAKLYNGTTVLFRARFTTLHTDYGVKHVKGSLAFYIDFEPSTNNTRIVALDSVTDEDSAGNVADGSQAVAAASTSASLTPHGDDGYHKGGPRHEGPAGGYYGGPGRHRAHDRPYHHAPKEEYYHHNDGGHGYGEEEQEGEEYYSEPSEPYYPGGSSGSGSSSDPVPFPGPNWDYTNMPWRKVPLVKGGRLLITIQEKSYY